MAPKTSAIRIIGVGEIENIAVSAREMARLAAIARLMYGSSFRVPPRMRICWYLQNR